MATQKMGLVLMILESIKQEAMMKIDWAYLRKG